MKITLFYIILIFSFILTACGVEGNSQNEENQEVTRDSTIEINIIEETQDSLNQAYTEEQVDTTDYANWEADYILIEKGPLTLKLYDKEGKLRMKFPVGVAVNFGNKRRRGDHRTPEGEFKVTTIQPSSGWTHDFHDGKGEIKGCYGPWFIRLAHPITTMIGIHGTHLPESIGTRCTEGCIRLNNDDIVKLKDKVKKGIIVKIVPGEEDEKVNSKEKK